MLKFRDKIAGVGWIYSYLNSVGRVDASFPISSNKFRVTQNEFPVRAATGIRSQRLDLPRRFRGRLGVVEGKP
jgi:hypothetical protein